MNCRDRPRDQCYEPSNDGKDFERACSEQYFNTSPAEPQNKDDRRDDGCTRENGDKPKKDVHHESVACSACRRGTRSLRFAQLLEKFLRKSNRPEPMLIRAVVCSFKCIKDSSGKQFRVRLADLIR